LPITAGPTPANPVLRWSLPRPVRLTRSASAYLDIIRSLAATTVVLGHLRALFFVDEATATSVVAKLFYAVATSGHQAVMAFFVLSGFFISSSVLRNLKLGTWSWRDYAIDRGVRLYIVLVPGLALGGLWDFVGSRFFNGGGIYSTPLAGLGEFIPAHQLNISSFFGTLFFLQTRATTVFGSNGPLWSLFNEFWYYLLFPALLLLIFSIPRRLAVLAAYIGVAYLAIWILQGALEGFFVWLAGGAVALTSRYCRFGGSRTWQARCYTIFAAVLTGSCLFLAHAGGGWFGSDLAVGLSFALLTHGLVQLSFPIGAVVRDVAKSFAGFSYSLYVLHFPLLLLIRAKWLPALRWQPDGAHLLGGAGIAAGVLCYAFAVAQITEAKTSAVRSRVRAIFR
jgi:peptidoglycan/LPS O-acetylase OafA/YrhL